MESKNSKKGANRTQALADIKEAGFESQNAALLELGFTTLRQNLKYLKKFNGDVEKAAHAMADKVADEKHGHHHHKHHKYDGDEEIKAVEKIKKLGWETQNEALIAQGFTWVHKNYKALSNNGGDLQKALVELEEKKTKHEAEHQNKHSKYAEYMEEIKKLGYEKQHNALIAMGFGKAKDNLKTLVKNEGNLEKSVEYLKTKRDRKNGLMDKYQQYSHDHQQIYIAEIKASGWEAAYLDLVAQGFWNPKHNYSALRKSHGDVAKALTYLKEKREKHATKAKKQSEPTEKPLTPVEVHKLKVEKHESAKEQHYVEEIKKADWMEEHEKLCAEGYDKPKKNFIALKKVDGNLEKALELLGGRKQKKQELKKQYDQEFLHKQEIYLAELKKAGWEQIHLDLVAKGFWSPKKNFKALTKCGGKQEDAEKLLAEKRDKKLEYKLKYKHHHLHSTSQSHSQPHNETPVFPDVAFVTYDEIPTHIERLFLHGNQLLFVDHHIRKFAFRKETREVAEKAVHDIIHAFGELFGRFHVTLVFDTTKLVQNTTINGKTKVYNYGIVSATPGYHTLDECLLECGEDLKTEGKSALFVTSDKELKNELATHGVEVIRPGKFWKIVKTALGDEKYHSLLPKKE